MNPTKMKKKELESILILLDKSEKNNVDFLGFTNPTEAKELFDSLQLFKINSTDKEKSFSPYFIERVMGKVANLSSNNSLSDYLSLQFSRVMAYGLAAVIIVMLTLYFIQGQEGFVPILGNDSANDINFISYLFYEF